MRLYRNTFSKKLILLAQIWILILISFIVGVSGQETHTNTLTKSGVYLFETIANSLLIGSFFFMFVVIISVRVTVKQMEKEKQQRVEVRA